LGNLNILITFYKNFKINDPKSFLNGKILKLRQRGG
jgi:hypothetical protein